MQKTRLTSFTKSTAATAHGATLAKLAEHLTQGERNTYIKNVELDKSGSNIANHAWANDHKINFDGGKIIDKGTYRHRQTLESWHTACTKGSDNNSKHLPEQYRFLINNKH